MKNNKKKYNELIKSLNILEIPYSETIHIDEIKNEKRVIRIEFKIYKEEK